VGTDGLRWLGGAQNDAGAAAGLADSLGLSAILRAQAGLLADLDAAADALYGRRPTSSA
jgi:hypothetical protein